MFFNPTEFGKPHKHPIVRPLRSRCVLFSRRALVCALGAPNFSSARVGEQAALQEVYGDDVELCDTLVGNLAEDKIDGFAIR